MDLDELSSLFDTQSVTVNKLLDTTPPSYHDLSLIAMGQTLGEIEAGQAIIDIIPNAILYGIGLQRDVATKAIFRIAQQAAQEGYDIGLGQPVQTGIVAPVATRGAPVGNLPSAIFLESARTASSAALAKDPIKGLLEYTPGHAAATWCHSDARTVGGNATAR